MGGERLSLCDITGEEPIELRFKHEEIPLRYRKGNLQEIVATRNSLEDALESHFGDVVRTAYRGRNGIRLSDVESYEGVVDMIKRNCLKASCIDELEGITFSRNSEQQDVRMYIAKEAFNKVFTRQLKLIERAIDIETIAETGEKYLEDTGVEYSDQVMERNQEPHTKKVGPELMRVIRRRQDMLVALFEQENR